MRSKRLRDAAADVDAAAEPAEARGKRADDQQRHTKAGRPSKRAAGAQPAQQRISKPSKSSKPSKRARGRPAKQTPAAQPAQQRTSKPAQPQTHASGRPKRGMQKQQSLAEPDTESEPEPEDSEDEADSSEEDEEASDGEGAPDAKEAALRRMKTSKLARKATITTEQVLAHR